MTIKLTVYDQAGIGYETESESSMDTIDAFLKEVHDLGYLRLECTNGTIAYVYTPASIEIASQEADQ